MRLLDCPWDDPKFRAAIERRMRTWLLANPLRPGLPISPTEFEYALSWCNRPNQRGDQ